MSKLVTVDNLLTAFPSSLADDEKQLALAKVTAAELVELYESNDILALYARIDELDEVLLDMLAYDFKIDWWGENYSVLEKRETFKQCWNVKRKLGTPLASKLAFSAIFPDAVIQEWWQYNGDPYYFKIYVDLGNTLTDNNKLQSVINGIRYYKNKRSILERIEINIEKRTQMYIGLAMQEGNNITINIEGADITNCLWLTDEDSTCVTDENENLLFEEE